MIKVVDLPAYPDRPDECWFHPNPNANGYGAHRQYWELHVGPIPDGMDLDHECHNKDLTCAGGPSCIHRACYNPKHLIPKTRRDNLKSGRTHAAEVNERRSSAVAVYYQRDDILDTFREQGRRDALAGWQQEDRSDKLCGTCGLGPFKGERALTQHLLTHIDGQLSEDVFCLLCKKQSVDHRAHAGHYRVFHTEMGYTAPAYKTGATSCVECKRAFKTYGGFRTHRGMLHEV